MTSRNCPRCRGSMFVEDYVVERDWVCLQCGNRMPVVDRGFPGWDATLRRRRA